MNIAYAILLLIFGGLTLWLLTESKLKWYVKTLCITTFCIFTIVFWSSVHTFLGWPARDVDMPEKVRVHWVVIKEPDKLRELPGGIFFLVEAANPHDGNFLYKLFGYHSSSREPRQYGLPYSRQMHERLAASIIPKLKKGQPVFGKLTKLAGKGGPKAGDQKGKNKGGGSESQEQDWEFHELRPSDFLRKPTD